jgi:hypothetical protein
MLIFGIFLLPGCDSLFPLDYAQPQHLYQAYWNTGITIDCKDAEHGYDCDDLPPPWKQPRLIYSFLPPLGKWTVSNQFQENDGWYFLEYFSGIPGTFYQFRIHPFPAIKKTSPGIKRMITLARQGHLIDYAHAVAKSMRKDPGWINDVGAQDIKGDVVIIDGMKCVRKTWVQHSGPSPDPAKSGKWAGQGTFVRHVDIDCLMEGSMFYWDVRFEYFFNLTDWANGKPLPTGEPLTPDTVQEDYFARLTRFFDSFKFYGMHQ